MKAGNVWTIVIQGQTTGSRSLYTSLELAPSRCAESQKKTRSKGRDKSWIFLLQVQIDLPRSSNGGPGGVLGPCAVVYD